MTKPKKVRFDNGYMNSFMPTRQRGRMSNYSSEMMAGGELFTQPLLLAQYIHNGFARLICDKPAEAMTSSGFEIDGLTDDVSDSIKSKLEELDQTKHFNEAFKWRRAFGGALIVMGINDGGDIAEPVNEENIKSIEFLKVYDRFEAYAGDRYEDVKNPKFGKVEFWKIQSSDGMQGYDVHETRVLIFDGESVTNDVRRGNDGWGASVIQNCFKELIRLDKSYALSVLLLERMQQAVHGIPDLSEQVSTPEGEQNVTKRVDVVDRVRGALNTVIIDAAETYEIKSLSISGVKDILEVEAEALSAVSNVQTFILMGRNVGGLSSGSSNLEAWVNQVSAWQNDQYRKPLDRLISLIRRAETEGETDGGKYTIEFNPITKISEKDQAEIDYKKEQTAKTKADTLKIYADLGSIDEDEIREEIREDYHLIGDAPEPEPDAPKPVVLNPGQTLVDPTPGQTGLPVGT